MKNTIKTPVPRATLPPPAGFFEKFIRKSGMLSCLTGGLVLTAAALPAQERCATDERVALHLRRFPELAARRAAVGIGVEEALRHDARLRTVATIPVVVHVVYKGPLENISDAQIQSQMDVLNADFRLQNANAADVPAAFQPFAADVEFEFCLANRDPAGNPTTGITRTETSWFNIGQLLDANGSPRVCYSALGGADAWDTEQYLNIWVAGIGSGILGLATFPGAAPPAEDGVIIDPRYFGTTGLAAFSSPNHLGRTATHEIGHYFDLLHIWGGIENLCSDDDGVDDTPVQRNAYLGCPAYPQVSCGNSAMFMNYMDYTDDACMCLFTGGQKARMWAALTTARPGLLQSQGCAATPNVEAAKNGIRLYPNPAGEILWLETGEVSGENCAVQAIDLLGKKWLLHGRPEQEGRWFFPIGALPPGVYFLSIETKTARIAPVRFVKQ